jgi:5'-methylthioadenosine phosphorylase
VADRIPIAIVGGSGLYDLAPIEGREVRNVETPWGPPSDAIRIGRIGGRAVAFLARHGAGHSLLPSEIEYRANVWALKSLGVERVLSASAVGSLREDIHPREAVAFDQLIDRTNRPCTFFGDGLVAHVSMAQPVCPELRRLLVESGPTCGAVVHDGGTYLCIEGPAFSTRAESELYRSWRCSVIGMTNAQEAKLAREAEICYASLALVTDYDCWHASEASVTVGGLLDNLRANAAAAGAILEHVVRQLPERRAVCSCADALGDAILTPLDRIPESTRRRLGPLLERYVTDRRYPDP